MRDADRRHPGQPCQRNPVRRHTSRRVILEALLGLGATSTVYASLDNSAWRAYEAVEEAWIRDRHELVMQSAPSASRAAELDLEVKLADLKRRAIQFRTLLNCDPGLLRGGVWQLTSLPASPADQCELNSVPEYRKQEERVRQLTEALRRHAQYGALQRAQMRLWKTPQYREIHRRYVGRMQDLQRLYGNGGEPPQTAP